MRLTDHIARYAARLAAASLKHIPPQERPDLIQEIVADVAHKLKGYDADRGSPEALVNVAVESKVGKIARSFARRQAHGTPLPLVDEIARQDRDLELSELRHDIAAVLATLQDRDRRLCEKLLSDSVSQIARDEQRPRTTINKQILRIRAAFTAAGLKFF